MKKCPNCEINYILNDSDDLCQICKKENPTHIISRDNNKGEVEQQLLPLLRSFSNEGILKLLDKKYCKEVFSLNYPLLIDCKELGHLNCQNEVKDSNGAYRYYVNAYNIKGKMYHICSAWGSFSKKLLYYLKNMKENQDKDKS